MQSFSSWIWDLLLCLWGFLSEDKYQNFWVAMAPVVTSFGLGFIYFQIRHAIKSTDMNILLSLRDRFWSDEMVKIREEIKSKEGVEWLKKLRYGDIPTDSVKVYAREHIPRFTIFDFFETIGALYRRDKRLLKIIYPLMCGDIIFHYKLHEDFYNHKNVKALYPKQNFKYLAEACIKKMLKKNVNIPTFEDLAENILHESESGVAS